MTRDFRLNYASMLSLIYSSPLFNVNDMTQVAHHDQITESESDRRGLIVGRMIESYVAAPQIDSTKYMTNKAFTTGVMGQYDGLIDHVEIPQICGEFSPELVTAILCHELGHSTGHTFRLSRPSLMNSGEGRAFYVEELCAILVSIALTGRMRLITRDVLRFHKSLLEQYLTDSINSGYYDVVPDAMRHATDAVNYILGDHPLAHAHQLAEQPMPIERIAVHMSKHNLGLGAAVIALGATRLDEEVVRELHNFDDHNCDCEECENRHNLARELRSIGTSLIADPEFNSDYDS